VHVPRVVWSRTTRRALALEESMPSRSPIRCHYGGGYRPGLSADGCWVLLWKQISKTGFFHADPHPGNLFVTPSNERDEDGSPTWKLTFVDFGMVGRLARKSVRGFAQAVISVGLQDSARLVAGLSYTRCIVTGSKYISCLEEAGAPAFRPILGDEHERIEADQP